MKSHHFVSGSVIAVVLLAASHAAAGAIEGTVAHPSAKGDLVVYVVKASGKFTPPAKPAVMDQKAMKFIPVVLPVVVGTTVDFLNSDPVNHNVFSPDGEGYNLGTWPPGQKRSYKFKKTGIYTQLCSLHPEMEAFILVLENPYFTVTQAGKSFTIPDVPDGHYELKVWGKKLKKAEKEKIFRVDVKAGKGTLSIAF
jgi:plastocyanin